MHPNNNEFKPLIDKIIDSNQSWLINGPPGAGKTTLINMIKEKLTEDNKVYKCLAPTNLADAVDAPSVISWDVLE